MDNSPDMTGKICLVTGSSSGIGKEIVRGLAGMGATVVMVGRDRGRTEAAREEIAATTQAKTLDVLMADLSSQQAIRQLAADFLERYHHLHVLVNNAGAIYGSRTVTVDGIETTFAVNHLAYFQLTNLLLDILKASAPARIVSVASDAARSGKIDFRDLQFERGYAAGRAYSRSKLANILFTHELARRLAGTGVTANVVHPGTVATRWGDTGTPLFRLAMRGARPFLSTPAKGADTALYLATSPKVEGVSGKYFVKRGERPSPPLSYDKDVARKLWDVSAELTGLA
jgi:NAD(P)-dependent dehydrogenase (short-subunit alcohol dehydrogenase family)